ncbi:MAG: hypothetical protein ACI94Y_000896 [Maribacter sp.]|jgi:uncharacterized protein YndB with AHSA1/START domain
MERVSFDMEFLFRSSPTILYKFFTTPSAIIRWFCDEVDIEEEVYTFSWDGADELADMLDDFEDERVRFRWKDAEGDNEYWEIRFSKSEVTGETILEITDFCDDDEVEDQKRLWESQIKKLRAASGG